MPSDQRSHISVFIVKLMVSYALFNMTISGNGVTQMNNGEVVRLRVLKVLYHGAVYITKKRQEN